MNHRVDKLPVLIVNAHTRCNCRCVMCDIWKSPVHQEFTLTQLQGQMPALERLATQWVVFGGGEPLMHSDLFALCSLLKSHGIRVSILTTGLLLERFAPEIAETLDDVIVSLDGPPAIHDQIRRVPGTFLAIESGVAALHALRPDFRVTARCTVQRANHAKLHETMETARQIGLASISYLAADLSSTAFGREESLPLVRQEELSLSRAQIETLEAEVDALLPHSGAFVADTPAHLRRIVHHFRSHAGLEEPRAPRCNAPWVSTVLETDGGIRPCFFHPIVGSTAAEPLDVVLNQAPALNFRAGLDIEENPICRRCVCSLHL